MKDKKTIIIALFAGVIIILGYLLLRSAPIGQEALTIKSQSADLEVIDFKWKQSGSQYGNDPVSLSTTISPNAFVFEITIRNNGTSPITFPTNAYIDAYVGSVSAKNLALRIPLSQSQPWTIGASSTFVFSAGYQAWNPVKLLNLPAGSKNTLAIVIDSINVIPEFNENNNTLYRTMSILDPKAQ